MQGLVTPGDLKTDYLFSNDQTNSLTNLTLNLTLASRLTTLGEIKLTMPSDIQLPSQLTCIGLRGF